MSGEEFSPPSHLAGVTDSQILINTVLSRVGSSLFPTATADQFDVKDNSAYGGGSVYFITRVNHTPVTASVQRAASNTVVLKVAASFSAASRSGDAEGDPLVITKDRAAAASEVFQVRGLVPRTFYRGEDYSIDPFLGIVVGKRFDYDPEKAPLIKVAQLLARVHSTPTFWFDSPDSANSDQSIRERIIRRDPRLSDILRQQPHHSHCWQTRQLLLETGRIPALGPYAVQGFEMLIEPQPNEPAGVLGKFLCCPAFHPISASGKRIVTFHGDWKPDNMLLNEETNELIPIDFDLSGVGAAAIDVSFILLVNGYMRRCGPNRKMTNEQLLKQKLLFVNTYLEAAGFDVTSDCEAKALLLDAEVMSIAGNIGVFGTWHECEIALLRGREHPNSSGFCKEEGKGCFDVERPTGSELIDLFAEAVAEIRGSDNEDVREAVIRDGILPTIRENKHVMAGAMGEMLRKYLESAKDKDVLMEGQTMLESEK
eukprot:CAMPEP_0204595064 /NCGR_PEP_ID=MMETSP0661-20131031/52446_1 /ASSEMBLY_ACC=CAM_ASM_000606 /TAXON_ID=109239 /ORGANISM="Alexandrium margalefi, Strain AMGDE01CS-322" /LENGTH=483 /DNA_ID=CAMNT_0051605533 /DNA_START=34 /DNA_END=1485 /DNA_ORIENTATION=-